MDSSRNKYFSYRSSHRREWWPLAYLGLACAIGVSLLVMDFPARLGNLSRLPMHVGLMYFLACSFSGVSRKVLLLPPSIIREMACLLPVALAAELAQFWLPLHNPDWWGLAANLGGLLLAGVTLAVLALLKARREYGWDDE